MKRTAILSPDRVYRYSLERRWEPGKFCLFIGLNPSTADETQDDPTIRRCIRFARDWGYDALVMANLFAFRATNPSDMKVAPDPIGPDNDEHLKRLHGEAGITIAAWGAHGNFMGRSAIVTTILHNMHCLDILKGREPKHPLYIKADTKPFRYTSWREIDEPKEGRKMKTPMRILSLGAGVQSSTILRMAIHGEIDVRTAEDKGQQDMFQAECLGLCGN